MTFDLKFTFNRSLSSRIPLIVCIIISDKRGSSTVSQASLLARINYHFPRTRVAVHEPALLNRHACSYCEKSFEYKSHLDMHERIHTGVRPFICEICYKSFTQKSHLRTHMMRHVNR